MRTLAIVCVLTASLTGCGKKWIPPIKPSPPAETVIHCKPIPQVSSLDGERSQWEAEMIDLYADCAIRHSGLIRWVEGKK